LTHLAFGSYTQSVVEVLAQRDALAYLPMHWLTVEWNGQSQEPRGFWDEAWHR